MIVLIPHRFLYEVYPYCEPWALLEVVVCQNKYILNTMITSQISQINQTVLECLNKTDEISIVGAFAELGQKVLKADFGFVWIDSLGSRELKLVYKSEHAPFTLAAPKEGGRNYNVLENFIPDYVTRVKKSKNRYDVSKYVQSFVIIPLTYKETIYGTMVLCFKKLKIFSREKKVICEYIGNSAAQAITIGRLKKKENRVMHVMAKHEADLKEEQLRNQFLADATHEIRTPLAIIKGNVDLALLGDNRIRGCTKKTFNAISHEVEHLSDIISDLAVLTSNKVMLQSSFISKKVDLGNIAESVASRYETLAKKKKISITTKIARNVAISGDSIYLERLLSNLIRNSITYGKVNGRIRIEVSRRKNRAIIIVSDNGIGISKEDIPRIYDRFYRADKSHSSGGTNTGLGLAIVSWIVKVHAGTIGVKSSLGKGTTFHVSFPALKLD